MREGAIGVFDSGLGGLSVVKEIRRILPGERVVYLGDTARVPYGTRSAETIKRFAVEDVKFLKRLGVKIVVIACNTVAANALAEVKRMAGVPVFDVVQAARRKWPERRGVGVIATRATIASGVYPVEWQRACPLLVSLVEEGEIEGEVAEVVVRKYLGDLPEVIRKLILGCTHFPLLKPVIKRVVGERVELLDPAEAVGEELREVFGNEGKGGGGVEYWVTDVTPQFERTASLFMGEEVKLRQVSLGEE